MVSCHRVCADTDSPRRSFLSNPTRLHNGALSIGGNLEDLVYSFNAANTNQIGIVIKDTAVVQDEVLTSYWLYLNDPNFLKVIEVCFQKRFQILKFQ